MSRKTYLVTFTDEQRDAIVTLIENVADNAEDPRLVNLLRRAAAAIEDAPRITPALADGAWRASLQHSEDAVLRPDLRRSANAAVECATLLGRAVKGQR